MRIQRSYPELGIFEDSPAEASEPAQTDDARRRYLIVGKGGLVKHPLRGRFHLWCPVITPFLSRSGVVLRGLWSGSVLV
ncbi:hypothetical protein, partial [Streptomyces sp. NPDC048516]|uniref:hypothetical protein n=1 Tax=Streptomyces sp. NPDC048516 TaxID=3365565 RepID=UPI00371956C2